MIIPINYRGAIIEGFYEPAADGTVRFAAYVTHPAIEGVASYEGDTWAEAREAAETAIDELLASWN